MNIVIEPNDLTAGYSTVPLKVTDTNIVDADKFRYEFIINLVDNERTITDFAPLIWEGELAVQLQIGSNTNYSVGDEVLLDDLNNSGLYTGYYFVRGLQGSDRIIINLKPDLPFGVNSARLYKVIRWTFPPINKSAQLDLRDVLKDKLSHNTYQAVSTLSGIDYITIEDGAQFAAPDTRYDYKLLIGKLTQNVEWNFSEVYNGRTYDSNFTNRVALKGSGVPPFQIGESINLELDQFIWPYLDNFFVTGNVGYTSSVPHWLTPGQQIQVAGQVTNPSYNGVNRVESVITPTLIRTDRGWISNTPTEGGFITYEFRPNWNGQVRVTNVVQDSPNWVAITDINIAANDPLNFTNNPTLDYVETGGKLVKTIPAIDPVVERSAPKWTYSFRVKDTDWTPNFIQQYVIDNQSPKRFSTVVNHRATISKSAKAYLLTHINPVLSWNLLTNIKYTTYDGSNTQLDEFTLTISNHGNDYYIPMGLSSVAGTASLNDVAWYKIQGFDGTTARTQPIEFKIKDCATYEEYNVIWKDAYGSWLSYPFTLINRKAQEANRQNYYKEEGVWDELQFNHFDFDRGETNYHTDIITRWSLNTDWVPEKDNYIIEDMFGSAEHFLQTPEGKVISINMESNEILYGSGDYDGVFQYNIIVKESKKEFRK
jgi:hypothetical protein